MRSGPVPLLIVVMALLAEPPAASGAEMPPDGPDVTPEMTMRLNPTIGIAHVSYSQSAVVYFEGEVMLSRQPVATLVVELSATMDNGWSTTCAPAALVFSSNIVAGFHVTVAVPPRTLASEAGILSIVAQESGAAIPGSTSITADVTVFPYYMLGLAYGANSKEVAPGGKANFSVVVRNLGNEEDTYILTARDLDRLMREGWQVEMVQPAADNVPPNGTMQFEVYVTAPGDLLLPGASCDVAIEVKSRKSVARGPIQSMTVGFNVVLAGNPIEYPLIELIIVAAVLVATTASLISWRRRRKRKARAIDAGEAAP